MKEKKKGSAKEKHTPDGCKEIEKADWGAHCICERIAPFMSKRWSKGSAPTANI